jgi:hypothetical protein
MFVRVIRHIAGGERYDSLFECGHVRIGRNKTDSTVSVMIEGCTGMGNDGIVELEFDTNAIDVGLYFMNGRGQTIDHYRWGQPSHPVTLDHAPPHADATVADTSVDMAPMVT